MTPASTLPTGARPPGCPPWWPFGTIGAPTGAPQPLPSLRQPAQRQPLPDTPAPF